MRLSFVYSVRDPDYGGGLLRRMQISLLSLADAARRRKLDYEVVVVEWNPPAGKKTLRELVCWPEQARGRLRFIEVPAALHRTFENWERMPFLEYVAKNAGIRRATGDWILSCSPDVILDLNLVQFLARRRLNDNAFYRIDRTDVDAPLSLEQSLRERLKLCARNVIAVNTQFGSLQIDKGEASLGIVQRFRARREFAERLSDLRNAQRWYQYPAPGQDSASEQTALHRNLERLSVRLDQLHTNASGDFMLMSRGAWFRLRAFTELTTHAHVDSIMCWTAALAGMQQVILGGKMRLYHQEHDRSAHQAFPQTDLLVWQEKVLSAVETGTGLIANDEDWGLARTELQEFVL